MHSILLHTASSLSLCGKCSCCRCFSSHTLTRGHWIQILSTAKKLFLNIRHKKMNLILVWIKKEKKQSIGNLVRSVPIVLLLFFCYCAKVFGQIKSDVKFAEQKSQILTWQWYNQLNISLWNFSFESHMIQNKIIKWYAHTD